MDQSSFAAPQDLSQRTTSFIASQRQGIHQMLLRHLITLTIDVRKPSAKRADTIIKERPVFGISPKTYFCLPSISGAHGCGPWLVRGTRLPACRICCLFTISNIRASHTQEGRREPHDKIHTRMDTGYTNTTKGKWWSLSGSNRRPEACKASALPTELRPRLADGGPSRS